MKIGEVAKHLDIPASTIRYYENKGLIKPPRRVSGKRVFSNDTVVTLRFIRLCQAAGFTINEIKTILEQNAHESGPDGLWQPSIEKKREEIKIQIQDLKDIENVLGQLVECRCDSIEQCVNHAMQNSLWKP